MFVNWLKITILLSTNEMQKQNLIMHCEFFGLYSAAKGFIRALREFVKGPMSLLLILRLTTSPTSL